LRTGHDQPPEIDAGREVVERDVERVLPNVPYMATVLKKSWFARID